MPTKHYVPVVPGVMFINNKNRTWFARSWTLVFNAKCFCGLCLEKIEWISEGNYQIRPCSTYSEVEPKTRRLRLERYRDWDKEQNLGSSESGRSTPAN